MATYVKQYYGIKFPFTTNNADGLLIDLNKNLTQKVESEIMHVILTPKGTRLKKPDFGTNLIKYIFEPNDSTTWENMKSEISRQVEKYVPNSKLNDIEIETDPNDDHSIYLKVNYSVVKGKKIETNEVEVKI